MSTALFSSIAGCSASPRLGPTVNGEAKSTATPTPLPTGEDRWGQATKPTLSDVFQQTRVQVDPDGTPDYGNGFAPQDANDPTDPASIAKNGNIYILFSFVGGQVPRTVQEGYVSADPKGKAKGPKLSCEPVADIAPQTFNCTALFTDLDYGSGVYYGVLITAPEKGFEQYGTVKVIAPVFTKLPTN